MDMPLGELYETLYMVLEALDRIFEFWLSASFAIVVAVFLGAERLTKGMLYTLTTSYGLVSGLMALRYWINIGQFADLRAAIVQHREPYDSGLSALAVYLTFAVFAFGTIGTLYFVWSTHSSRRMDT